jgi:high-affinity iron transporter
MAAQAAHFLVQADLWPALGTRVWDTSSLLSDRSLLGQTLHALIGYDAVPPEFTSLSISLPPVY